MTKFSNFEYVFSSWQHWPNENQHHGFDLPSCSLFDAKVFTKSQTKAHVD